MWSKDKLLPTPAVRATSLTRELSPKTTCYCLLEVTDLPSSASSVERHRSVAGSITRAVWDNLFVAATCPEQADHSPAVCNTAPPPHTHIAHTLLPCSELAYLSLGKEPGSSRLLRTLYPMLPWLSCHSLGNTAKPLSGLAPTSHLPRVLRLFPVLILFNLLPPLTPAHLES